MADQKLTALTTIPALAAGDLFYIVDISDTTDDPAGSSRKVTLAAIQNEILALAALLAASNTFTGTTQTFKHGVFAATSNFVTPFRVNDSNGNAAISVLATGDPDTNQTAISNVLSQNSGGLSRIHLGQSVAGIGLCDGTGGSGAQQSIRWGNSFSQTWNLGLRGEGGGVLKVTDGGSGTGDLSVGKIRTNQTAGVGVVGLNLDHRMPIYDAAGTLVGYIPIYTDPI